MQNTLFEVDRKVKPIVFYNGGKRNIVDAIVERFPTDCSWYVEPFLGGASVFLETFQKGNSPFEYYELSDANPVIIETYRAVRWCEDEVLEKLQPITDEYHSLPKVEDRKALYLKVRAEFNSIVDVINNEETHGKLVFYRYTLAAYYIFLSKLSFHSLQRFNSKLHFNAAFGNKRQNLSIYETENILGFSKIVDNSNVYLQRNDYQYYGTFATPHMFFYLDPPYRDSKYNIYLGSWNDEKHVELKKFCDWLTSKKAKFLLSNSFSDDGFVQNLYKDYKVEIVENLQHFVSGIKGSKMNPVQKEVLIRNYD